LAKLTLIQSFKEHLLTYIPAILITIVGFIAAYQYVGPAPPGHLVMGTGESEGAYHQFAQQYRDILASHGIELELRNTAGSVENLRLLETGAQGVDVAFVQGGMSSLVSAGGLLSLGSLYYEPVWVFYRSETPIRRLSDLKGRRVAIGEQGSGTRVIAQRLLADSRVTEDSAALRAVGGARAAQALSAGELDAAFFVASPQSQPVKDLLQTPDVGLMNFDRAAAYRQMHRFLSSVTLPEGVVDLYDNIPPRDTALLAATTNLVVHSNVHPALVDLLLQAAAEVHGAGGGFEQRGEFPSSQYLDFPLSKEARRFYKSGPPFFQRYLPFWAASLIDRLKVLLIPFFALLLPLAKSMPPVYRWRVRSKIYRWYRDLNVVDRGLYEEAALPRVGRYLAELDKMEQEVAKVSVPLSYAEELYHLRVHINLVQKKLRQIQRQQKS
jgi:TRAP transporter TAXI family solute receptor